MGRCCPPTVVHSAVLDRGKMWTGGCSRTQVPRGVCQASRGHSGQERDIGCSSPTRGGMDPRSARQRRSGHRPAPAAPFSADRHLLPGALPQAVCGAEKGSRAVIFQTKREKGPRVRGSAASRGVGTVHAIPQGQRSVRAQQRGRSSPRGG